ncbi:MAG: biotin/lipoyl-binding protein, partial [Clostridia bacterium]|nr:biotin/lipoyl-binding protein [Clostridia bacterium]
MNNRVFREVSIERLSSPEQLDQMMSVTSPRAWFSLIALAAILFTTIIWSILGSIPYKTEGEGILIKSEGVYNISHTKGGKIIDISVKAGDIVKKGDIVARIEQPEL